jgi:Putative prokaryotic signal transducing protein
MEEAPELVTVYRSMDQSAKQDCETLSGMLTDEGLAPVALDDSAPGVTVGTFEVRVPSGEAARAEELIAANPLPDEVEEVDPSHELDLEPIFHSEGSSTAELEATAIKSVLESNGIAAVIFGDSVLPNLPFEVRVAKDQADRARELVAEAVAGGPAAAEEAELLSEHAAKIAQ